MRRLILLYYVLFLGFHSNSLTLRRDKECNPGERLDFLALELEENRGVLGIETSSHSGPGHLKRLRL